MQEIARALTELKRMYETFLRVAPELEKKIASIKQGPPGTPGISVNYPQVVQEVLRRMPAPEAIEGARLEAIAGMVVKKLPRLRARRGKAGEAGRSVSPEQMLELIKDRKFGTKDIEGLEQTLAVFRNFMMHGGVRGGGDTVVAGSGITITNTVNGNKQIASSSSGVSFETPTGTINGINTTFVATNTPKYIVVDGVTYFENDGYSLAGLTITTIVPPTGFIRSAY